MDEGDRPRSDDELPEGTEPSIDGDTEGAENDEISDEKADKKTDQNANDSNDPRPETQTTDSNLSDETDSNPIDQSERNRTDQSEPKPIPNGPSATDGDESLLYRFRHDREGVLMWLREMLSSVAIVLVLGLLLFGVSGVWPPMVAVESGSMEPNMEVGDLVFVTEPGRLAPDAADNDIGVVTHEVGETADYRTFGSYGSVVIYRPPGRTASPIIHRAMFHVEEGENWYDRADDEYHNAASCEELRNCPAPHDGYITLGDNNGVYDQARGLSEPVRAEWVTGVARVRVPYLGYVRLIATGQAEPGDVIDAVLGTITTGPAVNGIVSSGTIEGISGFPTNENSFENAGTKGVPG